MNDHSNVPLEGEEITTGLPATLDTKSTLAVAIARQEIDHQITTAKSYPRSISQAVQRIKTLATLDEETAKECVYALKRAGTMLSGPSIRFAEIVGSQWGNARCAARVIHIDKFEGYVEAEAVFHDLETNYAVTARARRRIKDKEGRVYKDDMILVTGQAAQSIALRNAILSGTPKGVWRQAYYAVTSVVADDIKTLGARRQAALQAFGQIGVTPEQVFEALGVKGVEDIELDHITTLGAMHRQLRDGESTVEEMFPPPKPKPGERGARKSAEENLDDLARGKTPPHDPETGEVKPESNKKASAASPTASPVAESRGDERQVSGRAEPSKDGSAQKPEPAGPGAVRASGSAPQGPRVGDDPGRDGATLEDLRREGERRAAEGSDALREFEEDLNDYETELVGPIIGRLRKAAKHAGNGGAQ